MKAQVSLLSIAIASGLALSAAPAQAAGHLKSASVSRAQALITGNPALVRRAPSDAFVARDTVVDDNGTEHVRFQRSHRGLPVIGGDFVVHSRNGKVTGVSQSLKTTARPGLKTLYISGFTGDLVGLHSQVRLETNFLQKPFTVDGLARKVRDILGTE